MKKSNYSVNEFELKNNLSLTLINGFEVQSVTIMLLVGSGSRHESEDFSGSAHFLEHMFFKGSSMYPSSNKLAMAMEMLGGLSNAFTSYDYTGYYIKVPLKNFDKAIELIADIILNPIFKLEEFEKEKGVIEEEIRMYDDLPSEKIKDEFNKTLFLDHPLGRNIAGTIQTLGNIKIETISGFRDENYFPNNMRLIIAGDLTEKHALQSAEKYFAQLKDKKTKEKQIFKSIEKIGDLSTKHLHIKKNTEQSHVVVGGISYERNHLLEYPMKVGMTLLSDGFGSRLFQSLREKLGIAYYIGGGVATYDDLGKFYIRAGIANNSTQKGVDEILQSFKDLSVGTFSQEELDRAKNYHISSILNNIETGEDKAGWFGISSILNKKHKTPEEQIKEIELITKEGVKQAWEGVVRDNNILVAIISEKDIKY
jgi:predicted Zn-dependent peptidase